jgi:8-oxo-dGTP pyrophosphatase MutT (NUDIX family)
VHVAAFEESYVGQLRAFVGHRLLLIPGARIVIERADGRVLLQLRTDFKMWGLPGGNAEPGERIEEVLVREVREETGLDISGFVPFAHASDPRFERIDFPNGDQTQFFVLNFWTTEFSGSLSGPNEESAALGWHDLDSLPEMLPNMRRSLDAYRRYRTSGAFQLI